MAPNDRCAQTAEDLLHQAASLMAQDENAPTQNHYQRLHAEIANTIRMAAVWAQLADTALKPHPRTGGRNSAAGRGVFARLAAEFLADPEDPEGEWSPGAGQ
ncbi:hypothetical protein [Streptomyces sp. NBC_00470]|uniref:hypothetical protein n=1 Tax=Streptomyces sp. NBC_00470 TaxID=2975753 RepID=UPI002F90933A